MYIDKISLDDKHPMFEEFEKIVFSTPDQKNIGSGLNYIIGGSGTGKTNFLELFATHGGRTDVVTTAFRGQRITKKDYGYSISIHDENGEVRSEALRLGEFVENKNYTGELSHEDYLYPDIEIDSILTSGKKEKKTKIAKTKNGDNYAKDHTNSGFGEQRFNNLMRLLSDHESISENILIIEEIELGLDPENQIKLLKKVAQVSKTKQVFITTHSPYIIDWYYLTQGASVVKMNRVNNKTTLGLFKDEKIASIINKPGRRHPHLRGVESKNIFFSNKILVTEGQEDVGIISKWLEDEGKDYGFIFFGYGAGGACRIPSVLKLCKDLKIPRVSALFDREIEDEPGKNEKFLKCKESYSDYNIQELLATDIRDKDEEGKENGGAFTKKGELKDDALGKDFKEKINEILNYFNE